MTLRVWCRSSVAIKFLLSLIFISKISFSKFSPIPHKYSIWLMQGGLHPYVNVFLNFLFALLLAHSLKGQKKLKWLSPFYKIFGILLLLTLLFQTIIFPMALNKLESPVFALGAILTTFVLVIVFGMTIPLSISEEQIVVYLQKWSGNLVLLSLMTLPLMMSEAFKGGRFVGLFKHIPYMVTCANLAFVFSVGMLLSPTGLRHKKWTALIAIMSFVALILTGTRSALGSAIIAMMILFILSRPKTFHGQFYKHSVLSIVIGVMIFFLLPIFSYSKAILIGEKKLGLRAAQNGLESRWEEISRGLKIFSESPWWGQGLLSKFGTQGEFDIASYNSFRDPHNLFVSSGVVGGWPLLFLSIVGVGIMLIACLKKVLQGSHFEQVISAYLLSHLPILLIYHAHLSLGGMADRIYWLLFGFLALSKRKMSK